MYIYMYIYVCGFAQPQLVTEALLRRMATAVLGTGRATNAKLARLFFVIGHVAVKHLVSVEKRAVAKAKTVSAAQEKVRGCGTPASKRVALSWRCR